MNRTALITGASSGLGLEFARIYAKEGYDLVLVARNEEKLCQVKKELEEKYNRNVQVFAQDLSVSNAADNVFHFTLEKRLHIDALVNNAGFGDYGQFYEYDMRRQYALLQVNIVSMVQLTRYFLPLMVKKGSGHILNLSSVAAFCAGPKMSLYYGRKRSCEVFQKRLQKN